MEAQINKKTSPLNKFSRWVSEFIRMDKTKSTGRKIASSLWALFFGMLLAYVYIAFSKGVGKGIFVNPFEVIKAVFQSFNSGNKETILKYFLVFGFSSIACALSFKAGLFNIGIPGQMMITGIISFSIFIRSRYTTNTPIPAHALFICLILSIALAFVVGLIAGALKAYLNVHEVISTIMLNWIIVGFAMLLFQQTSARVVWSFLTPEEIGRYFADNLDGTTPGFIRIADGVREGFVIGGVIILLILAFGIAFIFNHTSLGYKIRMQGISKTNGKYIGVNDKRITIFVLGLSAAIAGIAGFFNYVAVSTPVFSEVTQPLNLGFEAIAISLLALNSPIGSLFSSLFYTAIFTSNSKLQLDPFYFEPHDIQVITSIILYMAATSVMFTQFKPIKFGREKYYLWSDRRYFAYKSLEKAKKKKVNLIAKYHKDLYKIEVNIDANNYEKLASKLEVIKNKFITKLNAINIETEKANLKVERAKLLFKFQWDLNIAKKEKNLVEIKNLQEKIKTFNDETKILLAKKIEVEFIPSEIREIPNLNKELLSQKKQIKNLRKELRELTDKYLALAMSYKNTNDETIKHFDQINKDKYRINSELIRLGASTKFRNKQQRTASIKNIIFEHKRIYETIILEREQMQKYPKGGYK